METVRQPSVMYTALSLCVYSLVPFDSTMILYILSHHQRRVQAWVLITLLSRVTWQPVGHWKDWGGGGMCIFLLLRYKHSRVLRGKKRVRYSIKIRCHKRFSASFFAHFEIFSFSTGIYCMSVKSMVAVLCHFLRFRNRILKFWTVGFLILKTKQEHVFLWKLN